MRVIKVCGAFKEYGSSNDAQKVLQNFHMSVKEGTIYSIMGASGCGKTTLISSIVGVRRLDRGDVEVFGDIPGKNNSLIGYVPQENALINEFTVREMIWFYGTIFGMKSKDIDARIDFLRDLLELPDQSRFIRNCSGGQQRRVSLAVALVHDPKLLILDEPTVGLDPLLRARIWDYMVELTVTKSVTILLSTHYVEEAKQSTHVGLMRNGVLVAEDTPNQIMMQTNTNNLEDAFLRLSELQETGNQMSPIHTIENRNFSQKPSTLTPKKTDDNAKDPSTKYIMKAMLTKNLLEVSRNINVLALVFILPIVLSFCLHFGVGGEIHGLKVGIVNDEVVSYTECFNNSLTTIEPGDIECMMSRASCHYIDKINETQITKIYYNSFEEAHKAVRFGKIIGFLHLVSNFSKSLTFFNDDENDFSDNGFIQVHLDKTNLQKVLVVEHQLRKAYEKFIEYLLVGCGKSANAGKTPLLIKAQLGSLDFSFKKDMITGLSLTVFFGMAALITATGIITETIGGTWNRALVAGVKPHHFFLSHLIDGTILLFIQVFELSFYAIFFLSNNQSRNAQVALCLIFFLIGFSGLMFGILNSIVATTIMEALMITQFANLPVMLLSGTIWPLEGMPFIMRYFGFIFPLSMPVVAFRRILVTDDDFGDGALFYAYLTLLVWICAEISLSIWLIGKKGFEKKNEILKTIGYDFVN